MFNWIFETYGVQIMLAVLCAIAGGLGYVARQLHVRYINTAEKRSVARTAAAFVEQAWKDIHGYPRPREAGQGTGGCPGASEEEGHCL